MKHAYVVQGSTGEYSDHREWIVCAFVDEKKAKNFCEKCDALAREAENEITASDGNAYELNDVKHGKMLLKLDEDARRDYTGTIYKMFKVELRI